MVTLLAESKTMATVQQDIDEESFRLNTPVMEATADFIMNYVAGLSPTELAERMGISNQLAVKARDFAYDFPHKSSGYKAIDAYIGEAFRAFDVKTLDEESRDYSNDKLRFISSVYGILKPYDIIKPYRFEFNKSLTPENKNSIQVFKPKITIEFGKFLKAENVNCVINLLPGDADKCLDWKLLKAFAPVHKICFLTFDGSGNLKTPIAKRLKELRGLMARKIMAEKIETFEDLIVSESDEFVYSPKDSKPGLPVFLC